MNLFLLAAGVLAVLKLAGAAAVSWSCILWVLVTPLVLALFIIVAFGVGAGVVLLIAAVADAINCRRNARVWKGRQ